MFEDFELTKRHAAVGLGIVLILSLVGIISIEPTDLYVESSFDELGNVKMYSNNTLVQDLSTVNATFGLNVTWIANVAISNITADLYSVSGIIFECGNYSSNDNKHYFIFTLDASPMGRTEMFIIFEGSLDENYFLGESNHFFVENNNYPKYPEPEFVTVPEDLIVQDSVVFSLEWELLYLGPSVARFTINGITQESKTMFRSKEVQTLEFSTSITSVGEHIIKLIIEPEYDIAYADEVLVNVSDIITNTTMIASTSLTTSIEEVNNDNISAIAGGAVILAVVVTITIIQFRDLGE